MALISCALLSLTLRAWGVAGYSGTMQHCQRRTRTADDITLLSASAKRAFMVLLAVGNGDGDGPEA